MPKQNKMWERKKGRERKALKKQEKYMNLLNTLTVNEKQEKKKKNTNEHDELEPDQAQVEDENFV